LEVYNCDVLVSPDFQLMVVRDFIVSPTSKSLLVWDASNRVMLNNGNPVHEQADLRFLFWDWGSRVLYFVAVPASEPSTMHLYRWTADAPAQLAIRITGALGNSNEVKLC
jgi:hypothetical protein